MGENQQQEALNAFQKLPFEMNEMTLKNLDPISIINFGKTSKFCDGLAENFDDQVFCIIWRGSENDSNGPHVLKFQVKNSLDFLYTLEVKEATNYGEKRRFIDSNSDTELASIFRDGLLISAEPAHNYDDEEWSMLSPHKTLAILKKYDISNETTVECWQQTKKGSCFDVAVHYLFDLLKRHQNSMKQLTINYDEFMERFIAQNHQLYDLLFPKNLEQIEVFGDIPDVHKFHSIDTVTIYGTQLNIEELKQFKSSKLGFSTDTISYEDCKQYLILWRDGNLHENLEKVEIFGKTTDLIQTLFRENFAVEIRSRENTQEGSIPLFAIFKENKNNLRLIGKLSPFDQNYIKVSIAHMKGEDPLKSIENFTD